MPSIFSRIVSGEIPATKVYEDARTLAFLDINPASRGHVLVVPKDEYPDIWTMPPELVAAVALTAQRLAHAIRAALKPDGLNILQNNGAASGQSVFHYHVHLIPRWQGDGVLHPWRPQPATPEELEAVAAQIRRALATEDDDSTSGG
jgi:histidine triad (HIT) family protein